MLPIDFHVICFKFKMLVFVQMLSTQHLLTTLLKRLPNLIHWMPLESRCSVLIFRSHGQRSQSNCCSLYKLYPLNEFWPLCFEVAKLGTVVAPRKYMLCISLHTTWSKVKQLVFEKMLSVHYPKFSYYTVNLVECLPLDSIVDNL